MTPSDQMKDYDFVVSGLFDGLFIMEDEQTSSLWNHMTGEAVYGTHAGDSIPISNLLHMNVTQAIEVDPETRVAISDRPYNLDNENPSRWTPEDKDASLNQVFVSTLGLEDKRLPRMDIGLGIWTEDTQRYYSVDALRRNGHSKIENLDGKDLLVVTDPLTATPRAYYWTTTKVERVGRELLLDDGYLIRNGQIFDEDGNRAVFEEPQQIFTRWYGFSLTFPETEVVR